MVVAIIGILAAVGVVSYQGYTESARLSKLKEQHAAMASYATAIIGKCAMGGDNGTGHVTMKAADGSSVSNKCNQGTRKWDKLLVNHFAGLGYANPYDTKGGPQAVAKNGVPGYQDPVGETRIYSSDPAVGIIDIATCFDWSNPNACDMREKKARRDDVYCDFCQ